MEFYSQKIRNKSTVRLVNVRQLTKSNVLKCLSLKKNTHMKLSLENFAKYLVFSLLFFHFTELKAQLNVIPFSKGVISPEMDGIIYSLPRNIVCVEISVVKTELFKGPYADYAAKYLGLTRVNAENVTRYSIDNVAVTVLAEPDPEQQYFIALNPKSKQGTAINMALSENGIISGFSEVKNISTKSTSTTKSSGSQPNQMFKDLLQPTMLEKVDTIVRRISVDTTTIEEKIIRRSVSEKSADQMARETAEAIRKIDENISNLVTGYQEVNYSKESLEFMISELRKTQNEYLSLFKGNSRVTVSKHKFYVTPQQSEEGLLESLCKFSINTGILPKNSPTGESVNLTITPVNRNKNLADFSKQREQMTKKNRGLYYRIPQQTRVSVSSGANVLFENIELISQLGIVTYLPASGYGEVAFNPVTGAISLISIN